MIAWVGTIQQARGAMPPRAADGEVQMAKKDKTKQPPGGNSRAATTATEVWPRSGGTYRRDPATGRLSRLDKSREAVAAIQEAIATLDPHNNQAWTSDAKPQVAAIELALGYDITASERDAAWDGMHKSSEEANA